MDAHFELTHRPAIDLTGRIVTAAVMTCGLCGRVISGSGGPGYGVVCEPCGTELQRGALVGAVVWSDDAPEQSSKG